MRQESIPVTLTKHPLDKYNIPVTVFGHQHLVALAACLLFVAWYINSAKTSPDEDREKMTSFLALLLFWAYPVSYILRMLLIPDLRWQEIMPFHMCTIMTYVAAIALVFECPFLRAVTYFMGSLVCIQALITPALTQSFPSPVFIEFFASHTLIVTAALYLPIVIGWRPRKNDFFKAFLFGAAYMLAMLAVNPMLGTNFGFVMHAPTGGSILDLLGPWPFYLFGMGAAGLFFMWLISLPFRSPGKK